MTDYGGDKERRKLRIASCEFNNVCMKKLIAKQKQGYYGWNDSTKKDNLEQLLTEHTNRQLTQKNLVDIANFCNFLWNLMEERE